MENKGVDKVDTNSVKLRTFLHLPHVQYFTNTVFTVKWKYGCATFCRLVYVE
jgi:hypothetical protein